MSNKKHLKDSGLIEKLCSKIDMLIDHNQKQNELISRLIEQNDQLISMMLDEQSIEHDESAASEFYLDGTRK